MGPPDCPTINTDCLNTWSASNLNVGMQQVVVEFERALYLSQVEVFTPLGGQVLVRIDAQDPNGEWVIVFLATESQITFAPTSKTKIDYVHFYSNPCKTAFLTNTLRLWFDSDLTVQYLEVDAVRMTGTLDMPYGVIPEDSVMYIPHRDVFGDDAFEYTTTDCPYDDSRVSAPTLMHITIQANNSPPILSQDVFPVSSACFGVEGFLALTLASVRRMCPVCCCCADHLATNITVPLASVDQYVTANASASNYVWLRDFQLVLLTLPRYGTPLLFLFALKWTIGEIT